MGLSRIVLQHKKTRNLPAFYKENKGQLPLIPIIIKKRFCIWWSESKKGGGSGEEGEEGKDIWGMVKNVTPYSKDVWKEKFAWKERKK